MSKYPIRGPYTGIKELTYDQYVDLMVMMLSGDPAQVASANRLLFVSLVRGKDAPRIPAVALHDIQTQLEMMGRSTH